MMLQELTQREITTARPEATIRQVIGMMSDDNVGAVVITVNNKVEGIVTDRDIALALGCGDAEVGDPVSDIMTREVVTIWEDQGVFNATQYFQGHRVRRLPVIDRHDQLVGMVSLDDVFGLLVREMFNAARALEPSLGERV